MKPIYYRPVKLALAALTMGASTALLFALDDSSLWSTVFGTASGIGAIAAGACAIDQRPALALDGSALAVRTMFRRRVIELADILVVSIEARSVRLWGIIPIARRHFLVIRSQGGVIGSQKLKLSGSMLALPPGGLQQVAATIQTLRGTSSSSTAPPRVMPVDGADTGFDPDAAIARYLAQKAANPAPTAAPPPAAPMPGPARTTFGRRVA